MCRDFQNKPGANGRLIALSAAVFLIVFALAGCGKQSDRKPVFRTQGKVLFQGQPAVGAYVTLHLPVPDPQVPVGPRATVGPDGSFMLSTYEKEDGAPAGDYAVTVAWRKPVKLPDGETTLGPNLLPPRYEKPDASGLRATVSPDAALNELPAFLLTR